MADRWNLSWRALVVTAGVLVLVAGCAGSGSGEKTATSRTTRTDERVGDTARTVPGSGSSAGGSTAPAGTAPDGIRAEASASATSAWAWTQLTDKGTELRVATPDASCPEVKLTKGGATSTERLEQISKPVPPKYPTSMCRLRLPDGLASAVVQSATPVLPNAKVPIPEWTKENATTTAPTKIVVIGDTGCRTVQGGTSQDCTSSWPFEPVASSAASGARPDLIIHTGDYIYRSDPLVSKAPGCDTKDDHTWGCLVADFFHPGRDLLAQAPIIFVRGNHEICERSGAVWFRYQAAALRGDESCSDYTDPVSINAGKLGFVLFDASLVDDDTTKVNEQQRKAYEPQFKAVNDSLAKASPQSFLLIHKPMWTVTEIAGTQEHPVWVNHTLDAAAGSTLDERIRAVLSGHVHLYQLIDFGPTGKRQPQITVGSSGTELDPTVDDTKIVGKPVDGVNVAAAVTHAQFGYATLRDQGGSWVLDYYDRKGQALGKPCTLKGTSFSCG